jgi:hypothetical protein
MSPQNAVTTPNANKFKHVSSISSGVLAYSGSALRRHARHGRTRYGTAPARCQEQALAVLALAVLVPHAFLIKSIEPPIIDVKKSTIMRQV